MKIFFLCLCAFLFSVSVRAETFYYRASGAGMHLMDAAVEYTATSKEYQVRLTTKTRGLLSFLVDSQSVFFSRGVWNGDEPVVVDSYMEISNGDRIKRRVLAFHDKEKQLDYPSVFMHRLVTSSPEAQTYTVFDGKRTLRVTFRYEGDVSGTDIDNPTYPRVHHYTVTVDIVSGKKKGWFFNRMKDKSAPPLHLYFSDPDSLTGRQKLVYAAFDTALFGQITIRETVDAKFD